jgi:hypothetical protein
LRRKGRRSPERWDKFLGKAGEYLYFREAETKPRFGPVLFRAARLFLAG